MEDENTYHPFHGCHFAKAIWNIVLQNLKFGVHFEDPTLQRVIQNWLQAEQVTDDQVLPFYILWVLQITSNKTISENKEASIFKTTTHILSIVKEKDPSK